MSKTFGYTHRGTGRGWFESEQYSDRIIEQIKDPEGGIDITLPTAIPSPFARMDLVRTAFINITKSPNLTAAKSNGAANRDNEKLVSETLDLAEILFNFDLVKEHIKIHVWDREKELSTLKSGSVAHRALADTLELYLSQDKKTYNFDDVKHLFLIEYEHTIIGCTSPSTMFFSSANDISKARIKLTKNYTTFGDKYTPLYERDEDFQVYLYSLFSAYPELGTKLKPVAAYLDKNLKILEQNDIELFKKIKALDKEHFHAKYSELDTGRTGEVISILGIALKKRKKADTIAAIKQSDFILYSTKYQGDTPPLVLQNHLTKTNLQYAMDKWDNNIPVPYFDPESNLNKRTLPGLQINYPYLTVSDFLEPYLLSLPYPVHQDNFFDGNLKIENGKEHIGYLLPLKKLFFEYFTTQDLVSSNARTPEISIVKPNDTFIKVTLKLPIAKENEFITFERFYHPYKQVGPNESSNEGVIWEQQMGLTLFPFLRVNDKSIPPHYRVQLIDRNLTNNLQNADYKLEFYLNENNESISIRDVKRRVDKHKENLTAASTDYYVLESDFDYIEVLSTSGYNCRGIIIPKWRQVHLGSESFKFAIDFGTTNTHIEYRLNNQTPIPFDITPGDIQIAHLFDPRQTTEDFNGRGFVEIRELINQEFLPAFIQKNNPNVEYSFPQRTVLAEATNRNPSTNSYSLADYNIAFDYGKRHLHSKLTTNLKWSKKEKANTERIEAFFDQIVFMIRNKVLLGKGDPAETQITGFYPTSMKPARRSYLQEAWTKSIEKYLGRDIALQLIPESIAPYYHYKDTGLIKAGGDKPVVSIDIGGGTSDILIFSNNKPQLQTSFRFAGNALFGDAFSEAGSARSNNLILKYTEYFKRNLTEQKLHDLKKVFDKVLDTNRSEEINNFLLSLENSPKIKSKKAFSYSDLLSDDENLKIVFLYFYTAIVYHVAQICKRKEYKMPKYLVFSGTGSNILNLISRSKNILNQYSMAIFSQVYDGQAYDDEGLTVTTEREYPKEVTCKAGLLISDPEQLQDIDRLTFTHNLVEDEGKSLRYGELTPAYKETVINEVKAFNEFFISLNKRLPFDEYFEVSTDSLEFFKIEMNKHLIDHLESGIEMTRKIEEVANDDVAIGETLFFYPIIGTIRELISELANLNTD